MHVLATGYTVHFSVASAYSHEMMKVLFVDNMFTRNLADVSIRCSNPSQGEMKLDWRDSAFNRLSRLRTYGKPILLALVSVHTGSGLLLFESSLASTTVVCVNLALFVWSTNKMCAICSKFKSAYAACVPVCVDEILFCTHVLFPVGDSRLTQTAIASQLYSLLLRNATWL